MFFAGALCAMSDPPVMRIPSETRANIVFIKLRMRSPFPREYKAMLQCCSCSFLSILSFIALETDLGLTKAELRKGTAFLDHERIERKLFKQLHRPLRPIGFRAENRSIKGIKDKSRQVRRCDI